MSNIYEVCASLVRTNQDKLAHSMAVSIKAANFGLYEKMDFNFLVAQITRNLENQMRYFESGDFEEWREYCLSILEARIEQGFDYSDVVKASTLVSQELEQFFSEQLPALGPIDNQDSEAVLAAVKRRLHGLATMTRSVAVRSGIAHNKKAKQDGP
jgi:hypothetical protein